MTKRSLLENAIKIIEYSGPRIGEDQKEIINDLYHREVLDNDSIENSLDSHVRKEAREYFNLMVSRKNKLNESLEQLGKEYSIGKISEFMERFSKSIKDSNNSKRTEFFLKQGVARSNNPLLYADHVGRPEFFAYAIENGEFNEFELSQITFDHGENPKSFSDYYGDKNLLRNLREDTLGTNVDKKKHEIELGRMLVREGHVCWEH